MRVEPANSMFQGHSRTRSSLGLESKPGSLTLSARAASLVVRLVLLWVALAPAIAAQIPGKEKDKAPSTAPQEEPAADLFGRNTPRGTVTAFIRAVHRDDYVSAARYLQIKPKQRSDPESLARELSELFDRYFSQPVSAISDSPDGALDDGLPIDREQVGPLRIGEDPVEIGLIRVKDKDAGQI